MSSRSTILTDQLRQTAVLWQNPVPDGFGGQTFGHGVEIKCRWEEKQELFVDFAGRTVLSRAVVYVDRDLQPHDYLYLGTNEDLATVGIQPFDVAAAFEVRAFKKVPNIDATRFVRTAWL